MSINVNGFNNEIKDTQINSNCNTDGFSNYKMRQLLNAPIVDNVDISSKSKTNQKANTNRTGIFNDARSILAKLFLNKNGQLSPVKTLPILSAITLAMASPTFALGMISVAGILGGLAIFNNVKNSANKETVKTTCDDSSPDVYVVDPSDISDPPNIDDSD